MAKRIPKPTETELSILKILWDHGPCRVRDVSERLSKERGEEVGYTTALKFLQIMFEKNLVVRDESERSHSYSAAHAKDRMQRQVLKNIADKIFGGATGELALQALSARKVKPAELKKLRAMLDAMEPKNGNSNHE